MRGAAASENRTRLAIVVSHPIQYYVPLYQRLAARDDLTVRVFFTWHAGGSAVHDRGFQRSVEWDIPLTSGYDFESVPNTARRPGTDRFLGLENPTLVAAVRGWKPDVVHVTGWAWHSHLRLLRALHAARVPSIFRGDSHLLDAPASGLRWWLKRLVLRRVLSWPTAFLVVGRANRAYYRAFGVADARMRDSPHSIDVKRFAEPVESLEREASEWRQGLGVAAHERVLLYAGKFETKKQPLELARAFLAGAGPGLVLAMVGGGEHEEAVRQIATAESGRILLLPFQNQSRMPVVYRLGDLFILPSAYGETWGLAVNEALASSRPVLVSDRVGCAPDVVDATCGRVFPWQDLPGAVSLAKRLCEDPGQLAALRFGASARACLFDVSRTERETAGVTQTLRKR